MRKRFGILLVMVLVAAGCGGGDGDGALGDQVFGGADSQTTQEAGADDADSDSDADSNTDGGGTLENPTPEASGALPSNSFRIGTEVWERTISGSCFVQEGEGLNPFAASGTLDNDDSLSFAVRYSNENETWEGEVRGNTMFWVAGSRTGSELTVDHDVDSQTASGEGLFYNMHRDGWAFGSFQFTCKGS